MFFELQVRQVDVLQHIFLCSAHKCTSIKGSLITKIILLAVKRIKMLNFCHINSTVEIKWMKINSSISFYVGSVHTMTHSFCKKVYVPATSVSIHTKVSKTSWKSLIYGKKEGNFFFRGVIYGRFLTYNNDQKLLLSFPLFPHFASFETEIHRSFRNSLENCWQLLLLFWLAVWEVKSETDYDRGWATHRNHLFYIGVFDTSLSGGIHRRWYKIRDVCNLKIGLFSE